MLDIFHIEGMYCSGAQCETYEGDVSFNDIISGSSFNLRSRSGEEAVVSLNLLTFNINVDINDQKRELKDVKFITNDDGSWHINENIGNDNLHITIKPL